MLTDDERMDVENWLNEETFAFSAMPNGELIEPGLLLEIEAIKEYCLKTDVPEIKKALTDHICGLRALLDHLRLNKWDDKNLRCFDHEELAKILLTAPGRSDADYIRTTHPEWFITKGSWLWPPK